MTAVPPASAIADVLALWGRVSALTPPLAPVVPAPAPVIGRARTFRLARGASGAGLAPLYDALDRSLDGEVIVLAGADTVGGAVWGEILATTAAASAATAILVHGAVRDVADLPPTPLYAAGVNVVGPNGMAHVVEVDAPVAVGEVVIDHGDGIVLDATGCVAIAGGDVDGVLEAAATYAAAEQQVVDAVRAGTPLAEAYLIKKSAVDQLRKG